MITERKGHIASYGIWQPVSQIPMNIDLFLHITAELMVNHGFLVQVRALFGFRKAAHKAQDYSYGPFWNFGHWLCVCVCVCAIQINQQSPEQSQSICPNRFSNMLLYEISLSIYRLYYYFTFIHVLITVPTLVPGDCRDCFNYNKYYTTIVLTKLQINPLWPLKLAWFTATEVGSDAQFCSTKSRDICPVFSPLQNTAVVVTL